MTSHDDLFAAAAVQREIAEAGGSVTETTLTGTVEKVLFQNEEGTWSIVRIVDAENREWILTGDLATVSVGQDVRAVGKLERKAKHGLQLKVREIESVLPSTRDGIVRYLASGVLPGVGPKLAERIVDHFGGETLAILDRSSARLSEVPGLGKRKIETIRKAWVAQTDDRDLQVFLQGLGISQAWCNRIRRRYGEETAAVVRENPYRLASDVRGIGFRMADGIARKLNVATDNPFRLAAGVAYVLEQVSNQYGHCCFPREELLERAAGILEVPVEAAAIGLERAVADASVCVVEGADVVYPRLLLEAEKSVAARLRLLTATPPWRIDAETLPVSPDWGMYNEEQQAAVLAAFGNSVSIVTGGPGVGKTTVTREILRVARNLNLKVRLAAPTGRAAKRMSEACKASAGTIHRLLKWEPETNAFHYNEDRPLPAHLLIIDEASMIDVRLAESLLAAVPPGARLVLVGDRDQLPSVGPGQVLGDCISSELLPVTQLHEVYRQGAGSMIITNAHKVNRGDVPDKPGANKETDFYWIEQEDPERVVDLIKTMVTERIPRRFGFSPTRDVQVLTPMNRGSCGAIALNEVLRDALNPLPPEREWQALNWGDKSFRPGDRVMQIANNYDLGILNGDLGKITRIDGPSKHVVLNFEGQEVHLPFEDLDQLRLAYAVTIHKSQGSEFPVVVVPILTQHYVMLQRNLIYTAMTRARRLLILIGPRKALSMAVRNVNSQPRHTRLVDRLRGD